MDVLSLAYREDATVPRGLDDAPARGASRLGIPIPRVRRVGDPESRGSPPSTPLGRLTNVDSLKNIGIHVVIMFGLRICLLKKAQDSGHFSGGSFGD